MRLSEKVAVITGAASGIGCAVAELFAKEGATTVVVDLNAVGGEETVKLIRAKGGDAVFMRTDVVKSSEVRNMVTQVIQLYGKIDVLHNNAGGWKILMHDTVTEDSEEEWDRLIELNLKSIYLVSREVIPHMIRNGGGSIINTVSINSFMPNPESAAYSAAKAGGCALTKAMSIDYAKYKIRVNGIAPGFIATRFHDRFTRPEARRETVGRTPLRREGLPSDVAGVALFLASPHAAFLAGETIEVNGGQGLY